MESVYELPMNYFCPQGRIYMHTNYYHIYDTGRKKYFQIICELFENLVVLIFIFVSIANGDFSLYGILALTFSLTVFVYYVLALLYFLLLFRGASPAREQERKMYENKMYVKASVNQEMVSSMKNYPHIVKSYNEVMPLPTSENNRSATHKYLNTSSSL
jgi:hypothetical protein